jgi:DNA-binding MarR family transcriptional regulator
MVRRSNETHITDKATTNRVQAIRALARMARQLERSSGDLNLAHYRVLAAVADGDERASRVADRLALGKPTVSAAVESLTKRGLLSREDAVEDRRAATLALTPAGEEALAAVEDEMLGRLDDLCARTLDPDAVLESLARLGEALDEVAAERLAARKAKRGGGRSA